MILLLQLLIMTLVLMGFLLYKNQNRAREFIVSFVSTELVIAVEVPTALLCLTAPLPECMRPSSVVISRMSGVLGALGYHWSSPRPLA